LDNTNNALALERHGVVVLMLSV